MVKCIVRVKIEWFEKIETGRQLVKLEKCHVTFDINDIKCV